IISRFASSGLGAKSAASAWRALRWTRHDNTPKLSAGCRRHGGHYGFGQGPRSAPRSRPGCDPTGGPAALFIQGPAHDPAHGRHRANTLAQRKLLYYREPSLNLGVGDARGRLPHITGAELLNAFQIREASAEAYMLSCDDYEALARTYGRVGGIDRMATLIKAISAGRGTERVLVVESGDALLR